MYYCCTGVKQNAKSSQIPPRMQRKSESEKRERRKSRDGRGRARHVQHQVHHSDAQGHSQRGNDQAGGEDWETQSENSVVDERDDSKHCDENSSRRRNYHSSRHSTSSGRTGRRNPGSTTSRFVLRKNLFN